MTGPTTVDFMKGLLSLLNKYGFTNCFGGLAATNTDTSTCQSIRSGHELLNAVGQPCEHFVIRQNLEIVERIYKQGNLAFFSITGVLNQPSIKDNWTGI